MNTRTTITTSPFILAAAAASLVTLGATLMWFASRPGTTAPPPSGANAPAGPAAPGAPDGMTPGDDDMSGMARASGDITITLADDVVRRAGIRTTTIGGGTTSGAGIHVPAVIEPDGYATVVVTPLVAGRVTQVRAALGDRVRRGDALARIFSPELADAQARYVSDRAALDAHEQEVNRTGTLVGIGAASRQELERVHAEHAAHRAAVDMAVSRLELFGWSSTAIGALQPGRSVESTMDVPAPIDGVVTNRAANVGLNVDPASELFTVVDLSRVWAIGEVYEQDVARVREGMPAHVTTTAFPDRRIAGRIGYIDPALDADTRTARVRVELPNPRGDLRLGMLASIDIGDAGTGMAVVLPRGAVQQIGDRTVVYVADSTRPGTYVERSVRIGDGTGDTRPVVAGLSAGEEVVTEGSFLLRAERERLGLPAPPPAAAPAPRSQTAQSPADNSQAPQQARIIVTERGFEPARVTLRAGTLARLTFVRTTDATCATEVVIPALKERRSLPLNQEVVITFMPRDTGDVAFVCGMNMLRGTLVVQ